MIKVNKYSVPSSDGVSKLFCMSWIPDKEVVATLQISHGMIEHVKRYDEFARFLSSQGIAVLGHDHLGHGGTAVGSENLGYFSENQGYLCVLKDIHRVGVMIKKEYPEVPHFILGHSMGSFFLRRYLTIYGREVDGVVIMGTGDQPLFLIAGGMVMTSVIGKLKGDTFRSRLMHKLVLGNYNSHFKPVKTASDWLSRDEEKVKEYVNDPYCNFYFTCGAYKDLFHILLELKCKKNFLNIPVAMPVFLVSGSNDPVGDFGKGVMRVYRQFEKLGMKEIKVKLYQGSRHELINETDRLVVYEEISSWLFSQI